MSIKIYNVVNLENYKIVFVASSKKEVIDWYYENEILELIDKLGDHCFDCDLSFESFNSPKDFVKEEKQEDALEFMKESGYPVMESNFKLDWMISFLKNFKKKNT